MCFFFSLIPATIWVGLGYFVLFSSYKTQGAIQTFYKTQGAIQTFGQVLAVWAFVVAAFFPVAGAYVTLAGICP